MLALDIGGTKIAAALVTADGRIGYRNQVPTPTGGAAAVWQAISTLITETMELATLPVLGVGIAAAGPIDLRRGTISPINIAGVTDLPVVERVAELTGLPVRLAGDGVCMALGEWWRGAGGGAPSLLGIVVSTGVGGGLVLGGQPYGGRTGNAGHVGHVVVELDGQPCSCGGHGCVETVAAGPRMTAWARAHGWCPPLGAGEPGARELARAAADGDPVAEAAYRRGAAGLAAMIASVAAVCDLDLVLIGGGVALSGPVLFGPLRDALTTYAGLGFLRGLPVEPAVLGGAAGLVGAAALLHTGSPPANGMN